MNTNESYNFLVQVIENTINEISPLKQFKIKTHFNDPWITKGIYKSAKKCTTMYRKVIKLKRDHPKYLKYVEYRNKLNYVKRKAKQQYYSNKINSFKTNSKKLWDFLKINIGKTNDKTSVTKIFTVNGNITNDLNKITNGFGSYFSTIGNKFSSKIPNSTKSFDQYLPKSNLNNFILFPTTNKEVSKVIKSLQSKNSSGGNDILTNKLLKLISPNIITPLTNIFNKSMEDGVFPDSMKLAKVVPIYKDKDATEFTNYRPISLLPVISKVLEKLVHT